MTFKSKYWMVFLVLCASIVLPSCNSARMFRTEVAERSADAADQALESSQWAYCEAATIGALKRKFPTREALQEYLDACPERQ